MDTCPLSLTQNLLPIDNYFQIKIQFPPRVSHQESKLILRVDSMPGSSWPTENKLNGIFESFLLHNMGLWQYFFPVASTFYMYYGGIWLGDFLRFLCVWTYAALGLYVFLLCVCVCVCVILIPFCLIFFVLFRFVWLCFLILVYFIIIS